MAEPADPSVDERWMPEWLDRGFLELARYLADWARFDQWCLEHHRTDTEEEPR